MQALSKATPGETYTIQWMFGQPEVLDFLHSHSVDGESHGTTKTVGVTLKTKTLKPIS